MYFMWDALATALNKTLILEEVPADISLSGHKKKPIKKWNSVDVMTWVIQVCEDSFNVKHEDMTLINFSIGGNQLVNSTIQDLRQRSPKFGDFLYRKLDELKRGEPRTQQYKHKKKLRPGRPPRKNTEREEVAKILPFFHRLLRYPAKYNHVISWYDRTRGVFKITDSAELSRLWGVEKNNPGMTYDKMARTLRNYYKYGELIRMRKKLFFQFNTNSSRVQAIEY